MSLNRTQDKSTVCDIQLPSVMMYTSTHTLECTHSPNIHVLYVHMSLSEFSSISTTCINSVIIPNVIIDLNNVSSFTLL